MERQLSVRIWPDKILRKKCRRVDKVSPEIKDMLSAMYKLMKDDGGIGLAANQAGLDISLVVIEIEDNLFKLVNPRIFKKEGRKLLCDIEVFKPLPH